jgi:molecular chaperone DnaK
MPPTTRSAAKRSLKDLGDKVSAVDKSAIESAISEVKAVLDSGDAPIIKSKSDALAQVSMKLGEQLYKSQQEGASGAAPEAAPEPGVVDAEFSEVKDDKKSGAA